MDLPLRTLTLRAVAARKGREKPIWRAFPPPLTPSLSRFDGEGSFLRSLARGTYGMEAGIQAHVEQIQGHSHAKERQGI